MTITFVQLPSGKVVNPAHIFAIEPEMDMYEGLRHNATSWPRLGRRIIFAGTEEYWLDKADADALIAAIGGQEKTA